jgi:hypothetical protein
MNNQDIVVRFGGKEKIKDATKTQAIDDVWCWEIGKWVAQPYWKANMKDSYTGVTLRELVNVAKI